MINQMTPKTMTEHTTQIRRTMCKSERKEILTRSQIILSTTKQMAPLPMKIRIWGPMKH